MTASTSPTKRAPGQRGRDRQPRRPRLPPGIAAELTRNLTSIVDELRDTAGSLDHRTLREVIDDLQTGADDLADHVDRIRRALGE